MISERARVINRNALLFVIVGGFVLLAFGPLPKSASTSLRSSPMSLDDCNRYQSYFDEASASYNIPINLLKAMALVESQCQQSAGTTRHGCGVMQLDGPTRVRVEEILGITEDEICADTDAGARWNILEGALVLRDKVCYANPRLANDYEIALCQQNDPSYALSNEEQTKLSETLESWWFPIAAYNGGGKDGFITTSNYPYRVWSRFARLNIQSVSYPPLSRIAYFVRGDRNPDNGKKVRYSDSEIQLGDDDLYPTPADLGKSPSGGIRWTSARFNAFEEIPLHRNDGSPYSGTSQTLVIGIDPSTTQLKDWGESTSYLITVQDAGGNPISGATVLITNRLEALSTSTPLTNGNGQTTYTTAVPTGKPNGTYDIYLCRIKVRIGGQCARNTTGASKPLSLKSVLDDCQHRSTVNTDK